MLFRRKQNTPAHQPIVRFIWNSEIFFQGIIAVVDRHMHQMKSLLSLQTKQNPLKCVVSFWNFAAPEWKSKSTMTVLCVYVCNAYYDKNVEDWHYMGKNRITGLLFGSKCLPAVLMIATKKLFEKKNAFQWRHQNNRRNRIMIHFQFHSICANILKFCSLFLKWSSVYSQSWDKLHAWAIGSFTFIIYINSIDKWNL